MKTKILMMTIIASLMLLVSATVWEGVTDVVSAKDLPGNYSVATNAFPRNSVVDITNLENGKVVRALVVSGLETTGLLATLSRNAANSIELRGNSTCRIRITQPSDDIAFSHFKLGPVAAPSAGPPPPASEQNVLAENNAVGTDKTDRDEAQSLIAQIESDSGTDVAVAMYNRADYPIAAAAVTEEAAEPAFTGTNTGIIAAKTAPKTVTQTVTKPAELSVKPPVKTVEASTRTAAGTKTAQAPAKTVVGAAVEPSPGEVAGTMTGTRAVEIIPKDAAAQASVQQVTERPAYIVAEPVTAAVVKPIVPATVDNPPESRDTGNLSIIPSEERLPEAVNRFVIVPENLAPPLKTNNASSNASSPETSDFSPFQVPLISRLEQGKCYVQVAAYQRVDHVEDEISRIGTSYPLAIQNIGSDADPMFRILLGPLNQGESGAMLQRFKSIGYSEAFIRYN